MDDEVWYNRIKNWLIGLWSRKTLMTIMGRPYLDVHFRHVGEDMMELEYDYNQAMVRKLGKMGYDIDDPDIRVQNYIFDCWKQMRLEETGEDGLLEEDDDMTILGSM